MAWTQQQRMELLRQLGSDAGTGKVPAGTGVSGNRRRGQPRPANGRVPDYGEVTRSKGKGPVRPSI
jgi:hypothetical protein